MTPLLTREEQEQFTNENGNILIMLNSFILQSDKNLRLFNGVTMDNSMNFFLYFIERFNINSKGLVALLNIYQSDYRLKVSLNLLLRGINSDCLTALYLITFYDKNDPNHVSLINEFNILGTDHLSFAEFVVEEEFNLATEETKSNSITLDERFESIKNLAPELYDEKDNLKKAGVLRTTTNPELVEGSINEKITEKRKYETIKKFDFSDYKYKFNDFKTIYLEYRYYSQFQHFTNMSKKMIEAKPFFDNQCMIKTINQMYQVTEMILDILKQYHPNFIKK